MAPTICSEKDYRSRNRVRESLQKQSQNNNPSNYVGKITHRRSIAARNAKSIKFSIVNSYENDTTMYESNSINEHQHNQTIAHSINENQNEFNKNFNNINDNTIPTSTISSFSSICDRLTTPNQFFNNTNLTENKQVYLYQKQSLKFIHQNNNDSIFYDTSSTSSSSSSQLSHQSNCIQEITSTNCIGDKNDINLNRKNQILISDNNKYLIPKTTNSKGLVDIALKTITLIRRNQLLQKKLLQLQVETKEFIESVMSNPENQAICNIKLNNNNNNNNEESIISKNIN